MADPPLIYFVTAVGPVDKFRQRCWGWFPTIEEALDAVDRCPSLSDDGYYPYLVVEACPAGILALQPDSPVWWYRWDGDGDRWVWCKRPEGMRGHAFAFG